MKLSTLMRRPDVPTSEPLRPGWSIKSWGRGNANVPLYCAVFNGQVRYVGTMHNCLVQIRS